MSGCMGRAPRPAVIFWASVVAACLWLLSSPALALSDFTWGGATPLTVPNARNWSETTNWSGGVAPSRSVGTLKFPALPGCPSTDACFASGNDISGITANAISIDDGVPYQVGFGAPSSEPAVTLGGGGLTAAPAADDTGPFASWDIPLMLDANQTWSITGGPTTSGLSLPSPVTGSGNALTVDLSAGGSLNLFADDEVGAVNVHGSGSAPGTVALLSQANNSPSSLNFSDGNPISFSGGAELIADPGGTGPLTMTGGRIQIGEPFFGSPVLTVNGAVTLDSTSTLSMLFSRTNPTFGPDYSSLLSATGNVALGGANLDLLGVSLACTTPGGLNVGDVLTLVTTTGTLSGTFSNAANGAPIPVYCAGGSIAGTVRIDYASNSVTATVVPTPTATSVSASPTYPVTNHTVTLTATVTGGPPMRGGTAQFDNGGISIPSCANQPLNAFGMASCQTSFASAKSPHSLTATYQPSNGSIFQGSTSAPLPLAIGPGATATRLAISNPAPHIGDKVVLTATVTATPTGPVMPSATVRFLNDGTAIAGCISQPLTGSQATCTTSFAQGSHAITASYGGDPNFDGSSASRQLGPVQPSRAQISAALAHMLAPHGNHSRIAQLLNAHGFTFTFSAPSSGTLRISWSALAKVAKSTRAHKRPSLVAAATASFSKAGVYQVKIRLTRAGKRLLHGTNKAKITANASFTTTGGTTITRNKTFTLTR